jgi:hypothetical protein
MLFNSFTKVKYTDNGNKVKIKTKHPYDLNQFRYGVFAKIGVGNFSVFGYYNLTPVFKTERGPVFSSTEIPTEMQNLTFGISLSSF